MTENPSYLARDGENERHKKLKAASTLVEEIDREQKRLTGRKAEDYAEESGVPLDELFPENGTVLNVGDPWQTLDLPQVISIDYESGEEAMFFRDYERFLDGLPERLDHLRYQLDRVTENQTDLIAQASSISACLNEIENASLETYPKLVRALEIILYNLHNAFRNSPADDRHSLHALWFDLHRLMRGLDDAHLMHTVIEPELLRETIRRKGLANDEREQLIKGLISAHRFIKRTKFADFKKATFPDTPFEDKNFDRFVASWSVSTHLFKELSQTEFKLYWDEISRLLKREGVAYLWPVFSDNEYVLRESLFEYHSQGGDAALIYQDDGLLHWIWLEDPNFLYELPNATLVIFPKGASPMSKQRAQKAFYEHRNNKISNA